MSLDLVREGRTGNSDGGYAHEVGSEAVRIGGNSDGQSQKEKKTGLVCINIKKTKAEVTQKREGPRHGNFPTWQMI